MRAMVLAAGLGTRLRPITYAMPKPMVPVLNRPVMEHIVRLLARHGFTEAIANLHWFPEPIEGHFGDGSALRRRALLQPRGAAARAPRAASATPPTSSATPSWSSPATRSPTSTWRRCASSTSPTTGSPPWPPSGSTTRASSASRSPAPTAGSRASRRSPTRPRRSPTSPTAASTCSAPRSSTSSPRPGPARRPGADDPPGFADWAMDVFPALLEGDVPFYSHEIDAYWNDIGNLDELRQGNLDALRGAVAVEPGGARGRRRRLVGQPARRSRGRAAPALIGDGVELGDGRPDRGPGDRRRRLPDRRRRRGPRRDPARRAPSCPPRAMLVGGIAGPRRRSLTLS